MIAMEKLAYLKGLAEGFGVLEDKKEQKLLTSAFELIEELIYEIEDLSERLDFQELLTDELEEALTDLEDEVYDDDDDDDDDYDDDDDDDDFYDEDDEDFDFDGDIFDITCPNCEEEFAVDSGVVELGVINCPFCGERLEIEGIIEDDEDCGCDGEAHSHVYPVAYDDIFGEGCSPSACSSCGAGCGGYEEEEYDDEEEED